MFTKIDIEKFGLYNDFKWDTLPALGRVNIIYGRNYSGKTTLSRIFDSVSLCKLHKDYCGILISSDKNFPFFKY